MTRRSPTPFIVRFALAVAGAPLLSGCAAEAASSEERVGSQAQGGSEAQGGDEEQGGNQAQGGIEAQGSNQAQGGIDTLRVHFGTTEDIESFFEELDYSPAHWAAGEREVPRMFVTEVSERWWERTNSELSVEAKKRIFFRAMAPLALRANELIRAERDSLLALGSGDTWTEEERRWVAGLATAYDVDAPADGAAGAADAAAWEAARDALIHKVDEVPVSLVLAQSADESGWGTSRFAREGNALFGQWSFGGSGMLPDEQRSSLGNYGVASFESPLMSVVAYMRNLNTHDAYARLRELRTQARQAGEMPRGHALAAGLEHYSERGEAYVEEIRSIIEFNELQDADETYLAEGPVYLVVPAEDGA